MITTITNEENYLKDNKEKKEIERTKQGLINLADSLNINLIELLNTEEKEILANLKINIDYIKGKIKEIKKENKYSNYNYSRGNRSWEMFFLRLILNAITEKIAQKFLNNLGIRTTHVGINGICAGLNATPDLFYLHNTKEGKELSGQIEIQESYIYKNFFEHKLKETKYKKCLQNKRTFVLEFIHYKNKIYILFYSPLYKDIDIKRFYKDNIYYYTNNIKNNEHKPGYIIPLHFLQERGYIYTVNNFTKKFNYNF